MRRMAAVSAEIRSRIASISRPGSVVSLTGSSFPDPVRDAGRLDPRPPRAGVLDGHVHATRPWHDECGVKFI